MFGGLAAGFLASRFLKASSSRRYETSRQTSVQSTANGGSYGGTYGRTYPPAGGGVPTTQERVGTTTERTYGETAQGRPAEDVSLTGGVMPPGSSIPRPGETR